MVPDNPLRGRRRESGTLDQLLRSVRAGHSQAFLIRGEPGVGKTALLEYALGRATRCRVVRATGSQAEMELPYAALRDLCVPLMDGLDRVPVAQRDSLRTAFGIAQGDPPDSFAVGMAAAALMAAAAEDRPLICAVDDAQWLDQASAQGLAFVARRLPAAPVGLLFAARTALDDLAGVPELVVEGLDDDAARAVLESAVSGPLDERVAARIVAETEGNPLALQELPRGLTPGELAGGFGPAGALGLTGRIEASFQRRVSMLPPPTQRLLLVAAAEPTSDRDLVARAAALLGIHDHAAVPAAEAGLLDVGARITFRHPLVRSAVYRASPEEDRRAAHRALADAMGPDADPDRRAWHSARAAAGPDEVLADNLARSAERAQGRGGVAATAAFLERSAQLTADPVRRAERTLAAAQAKLEAGAADTALELLAAAESAPLDELQRARVDLLRAQVAFTVNRGGDAPPLLLDAAARLAGLDAAMARETYLEALSAAMFAGRLAPDGARLRQVAEAVRAAPPPTAAPRAADLLLDGLARLLTGDRPGAAPVLTLALEEFAGPDISREEEVRWLWLAGIVALDRWDYEGWRTLADRHVELAREAGALAGLPLALSTRTMAHLVSGELADAESVAEEVQTINHATGNQLTPYGSLALAAWQGREARAAGLTQAALDGARSRNEGIGLTVTQWVRALLYNGLGRHEEALAAAELATKYPEELGAPAWAAPELIEAAVRVGRPDRGASALRLLGATTQPSGTDWGLGIEARSRALVSDTEAAGDLFHEAIERLARAGLHAELARAHLLRGEWLHDQGRKPDARADLCTAQEMFTQIGAEAFAARSARALADNAPAGATASGRAR